MAYIRTIPEEQAENLLKDLYQMEHKNNGYLPNYTKAFSLNPEAYDAWKKLIGSVRSRMRLRRYELVTFATAMAVACTYWMLAHGALLRKNFFNADEIIAIVKDFHNAGLTDEEVAVMTFAQKVTLDPHGTEESDFDALRKFGLSDEEIMDVLLACTARNFFSKTLDAMAATPDDIYHELEPELQEALTTGRKF